MTVAQQLADGGVVLRETVPSSDVVRARFGDVDGLRALAIVAIVAYQTVRFVGLPARVPPAVAQLFSDASQGFTLFLMLSAFSLAYPIVAACRTDGATYLDMGRYAVKRLLRMYPAFLAVLAIAFALHPLAAALKWTALANAVRAVPLSSVLRTAVFMDGGYGGVADGTGNDGFAALALVARGFILLPIALFGWLRAPRLTLAAAILAAALDVLTPAHAFTLSAVLPLVLGIVAADVRVQHHRLQRFGLPLALGAGVVAFFLGPNLETMTGTIAAPDALRVDPFWSIALFGLVAAVGFSGRLEGLLGFPPLRLLGTAAYGISLVAMPVAALATRTLPERLSFGALAASTAAEEFGAGIVVWLAVDRWFSGDGLRRRAADGPGAWLDGMLAKWRASRIVFVAPAPAFADEPEPVELRVAPPPAAFYAPPPRPATDIPVFSTRTGSADELAAEILQTKARLGERSATVLDPEPRHAAPPDADPYAKPGFYRRPPQPVGASSGRLTTTGVATPIAAPAIAASAITVPPIAAPPIDASPPIAAPEIASLPIASPPIASPPIASTALGDAPSATSPAPTRTATTDFRADVAEFEGGRPSIAQAAIEADPAVDVAGEAPRTAPSPSAAASTVESAFATSADFVREPAPAGPSPEVPAERRSVSTPSDAWFRAAEPTPNAPSVSPPPVPPPSVAPQSVASVAPLSVAPVPTPYPSESSVALPPGVAQPSIAPGPAPYASESSGATPSAVAQPSVAPGSAPYASESSVALPSAAGEVVATPSAGAGLRVDSADFSRIFEPSHERPVSADVVAEPNADGLSVSAESFPPSYDGESPLEMLRAAYPPIEEPAIDEPATIAPVPAAAAPAFDRTQSALAFRLSAEAPASRDGLPGHATSEDIPDLAPQRPSLSAVEAAANAPWANEALSTAHAPALDVAPHLAAPVNERLTPGPDRTAAPPVPSAGSPTSSVPEPFATPLQPVPADDPILPVPEASAPPLHPAPLPSAPLPSAPLPSALIRGAMVQPNRPGDRLRPVVKASLLVRVFKHARAKFKPVVIPAAGAPAEVSAAPPTPAGLPTASAVRNASAPASLVTEAPPPKAAAPSNVAAGTTSSAHATPPPGRPSIRMRIGPTRVSHSDGDNG